MNWLHHAMLCYLGAGSAGEDEIVADEQNGGEVMIDCWRYSKKCGEQTSCQVNGKSQYWSPCTRRTGRYATTTVAHHYSVFWD